MNTGYSFGEKPVAVCIQYFTSFSILSFFPRLFSCAASTPDTILTKTPPATSRPGYTKPENRLRKSIEKRPVWRLVSSAPATIGWKEVFAKALLLLVFDTCVQSASSVLQQHRQRDSNPLQCQKLVVFRPALCLRLGTVFAPLVRCFSIEATRRSTGYYCYFFFPTPSPTADKML